MIDRLWRWFLVWRRRQVDRYMARYGETADRVSERVERLELEVGVIQQRTRRTT